MSNGKLVVIPFKWNEHTCYIGKVKYKQLETIVDIRSDLSMNRNIDDRRVDKIKQYILNDIPATFFPPTILNSKAEIIFTEPSSLEVKRGMFTVIDGQHRIKAIISLMKDVEGQQKELLNRMELPIFIVEGIEDYQHRDLFYMINETPKNVESNVSERFAPKLENLLGLKFFTKNKDLLASIEWNKKQSSEKIVYLHMTDCIRELNLTIYPLMKDWVENEKELVYLDEEYYHIIEVYWNKYFELMHSLSENDQAFFRKKITLRALVENLTIKLKENEENIHEKSNELAELIDELKMIIETSLEEMIQVMPIPYVGLETVRKDVYKSLRNYLYLNNILSKYQAEIIENEVIRQILEKIFDAFYDDRNLLSLSNTNQTTDENIFEEYIKQLLSEEEKLKSIDINSIKEIAAGKQTIMDEILKLNREECL
ncbi:hypothetical protein IFU39_11505 [Paenibacillus sp. CFBP 13594]|uniref:DNA sulfur modification protein DndB n=1 Tax=Paenibacillus sp. CFBP 13594 TaxID=2774037 RepID=UPI001785B015|nr:DNA sulfur modification protein DndB [Paenibacillus sp. CFBP 13594]MBD8838441.1 hypothetical protein [Paenibacillus sp. CFBP 13594]